MDFKQLINKRNTDITAWVEAIKANPDTPENALKIALETAIQEGDAMSLACVLIDMVRNADALLDTILEQGGFPVSLGEPVVVIGQDGPDEQYDVMSGLFDLPANSESGPVVSLW